MRPQMTQISLMSADKARVAPSGVEEWACPGSNAAGSRLEFSPGNDPGLQVRTRRSSLLAGFPLQSLTRNAMALGFALWQLPCLAQQNGDTIQYVTDFGLGDTLFLKASIADCGEFGGHRELIRLFRNSEGRMMASYDRDTVNCEEAYQEGFPRARKLVEHKEIDMDEQKMKTVEGFIRSLMGRVGRKERDWNSSNDYRASRTSLALKVDYSNRDMDWSGFFDMKRKLFPDAREVNWHR
jgi:hypothetical protein